MTYKKRSIFLKSASPADFLRPLAHLSRPYTTEIEAFEVRQYLVPEIDKKLQKLTKIDKTLDLLFSGQKMATDIIKGSTKIYFEARVQP